MRAPLLRVQDLKTYFYREERIVKAVDGVDFEMYKGETLGIVGESGCGKSTTALSIMQLISDPLGKIVGGKVILEGEDLLKKSKEQIRRVRGNDVSMIFQEPMSSLNPVFSIGDQIAEVIELHQKKTKKEALKLSIKMLNKVGIPLPERIVYEYPHQLSGGMLQRVMIAMALSCNPKLLIADEPTTALDVTMQAQILDLMKDLKNTLNTAIMLITHDLGVIAELCDRVVVMYAGKVVEYTGVFSLFKSPLHPYTQGLMNSIPSKEKRKRLKAINGVVPDANSMPKGCSFYPRCKFANQKCRELEPRIVEIKNGHYVSCWNYRELINKKDSV